MATVQSGQVKLDNGQLITPQQGGWYDGQQFWGGTLSAPGQINSLSNQQGAGQQVSREVIAQTNPANVGYIEQRQQQYQPQSTPFSQPLAQPTGQPTGTPGGAGVGIQSPQVPNLPDIYKGLYEQSGISGLESQYSDLEKQYIEAKGKINDNPFLSEATRVGRVAKLESLFTERTANTRNQIATKKADVETQLNLQMKQFDINSQAAKQALDQFNTLLSAGALDSASGEDIANLTRSTGIGSSMIYSAIEANQKKNVKTSTISFGDGTNQGFAIINEQTGEIIKKQNVASSKPKAEKELSAEDVKQTYQSSLRTDVSSGLGVKDIFKIYSGLLEPNQIISIYNATSPHGPAYESKKELEKYGVKF